MSKLLATQIKRSGKEVIFTTTASEYHLNMLMNELKDIDMLEVSIKKHKESRSVRQNNMLWAIIEKISLEVNGSKREDDVWSIYKDLLKRANVKHVILAAVRKAKPILESNFRYVEELPNSMTTDKGVELVAFKCYIGSSQFDTKEMTELIDVALDYAHQVGVMDSEILSIREEYKL
jgi:predicted Mrr-cat superfamily restriction endonuclease